MRLGPAEPTLLSRIAELERRIATLEQGGGSGLTGTDQTIKGCHDRLDSLLGAGVSSPDGTLISSFNADQLDGKEASAFYGVTLFEDSSASAETFTDHTSYANISNTSTDVSVSTDDILVAALVLSWHGDAARQTAVRFRLAVGTSISQIVPVGIDTATYRQSTTLVFRAELTASGTATVRGQCKVGTSGDTISVVTQQLIVVRFRPGG